MKFIFKGYTLFILLVILTIVSLFIGVSQLSLLDIFHLNDEQMNILFSSRIPRTVSILLSGSSLALAGLIMQQMMQNKFVSPTTAGTMEWAKLGILISLLFFPNGHILIKLLFAVALSIIGTFIFVRLINLIRVKEVIFVPLRDYDWWYYIQLYHIYSVKNKCVTKHWQLVNWKFCHYNEWSL